MSRPGTLVRTVLFRGVLYIFLILASAELLIYFLTPVYDFPRPARFSGNLIYNPYTGLDSLNWKKANFHFHTRAWAGVTSGRKNSSEVFFETYKRLGYDITSISNYQSISRFNADSAFYIPVYEHGFNIQKTHQLCLGAGRVLWLDYSFFQNLNHRQHILNVLHRQNKAVAIAHPDWGHGYSAEQMRYLSNYDLIEVLDANWRSVPLWDAALSSGHPAWILGDDDAHDISNPYQVGRCCTFINSATTDPGQILNALKDGKAFGADVYMYDKETFDDKAVLAKQIPRLNSVEVAGDSLVVTVNRKPLKIDFIGQDGKLLKSVAEDSVGIYGIRPEDTYIRTEITFPNKWGGPGTRFYLNPVFRYNGEKPSNSLKAVINWPRTWILRLLSIPSLLLILYLVFYYRRRKKAQS